ncbi:hypothetical protein GEZ73_08235 [Streptococcus mitis]|uniref:Uncharacterized protein n=1 Tax=Streptococcus mitis TaxID=28037 RepID=A0A6L5H5Z8_STRMT|nr:hypothetical protein [Streptococcus mitis]DAX74015.1 MAG TPA: hypothetical protein [Caudoviricetes sp.]MQP59823.1 hypothetical protein [Streptococcus mitis]MQP69320.1 hypothetical protein [Streptococcus mitis]MQP72208.1 hypothetical protein [Streptococcus mitis]MQP72935.1 hypothetical protein [Streptococcus mitis]
MNNNMDAVVHQLTLDSLTEKLAVSEQASAKNEALYLYAASELHTMKKVLEYDPALKELFEEVKGKMTNGN